MKKIILVILFSIAISLFSARSTLAEGWANANDISCWYDTGSNAYKLRFTGWDCEDKGIEDGHTPTSSITMGVFQGIWSPATQLWTETEVGRFTQTTNLKGEGPGCISFDNTIDPINIPPSQQPENWIFRAIKLVVLDRNPRDGFNPAAPPSLYGGGVVSCSQKFKDIMSRSQTTFPIPGTATGNAAPILGGLNNPTLQTPVYWNIDINQGLICPSGWTNINYAGQGFVPSTGVNGPNYSPTAKYFVTGVYAGQLSSRRDDDAPSYPPQNLDLWIDLYTWGSETNPRAADPAPSPPWGRINNITSIYKLNTQNYVGSSWFTKDATVPGKMSFVTYYNPDSAKTYWFSPDDKAYLQIKTNAERSCLYGFHTLHEVDGDLYPLGKLYRGTIPEDTGDASDDLANTTIYVSKADASCAVKPLNFSVVPNQDFTVRMEMENTGTMPWYSAANSELNYQFKLGYVGTSPWRKTTDNTTLDRVTLVQDVVPGGRGVFDIQVKAPSAPGTYSFSWKMIKENQPPDGWFGAPCDVTVTVAPLTCSPPICSFIENRQDAIETACPGTCPAPNQWASLYCYTGAEPGTGPGQCSSSTRPWQIYRSIGTNQCISHEPWCWGCYCMSAATPTLGDLYISANNSDNPKGEAMGSYGRSGLRSNDPFLPTGTGQNYYNSLKVTQNVDKKDYDISNIALVGVAFTSQNPAFIPNNLSDLKAFAESGNGFILIYANSTNLTVINLAGNNFQAGMYYVYAKQDGVWEWSEGFIPGGSQSVFFNKLNDGLIVKMYSSNPLPQGPEFAVTLLNPIGSRLWGTYGYLYSSQSKESVANEKPRSN